MLNTTEITPKISDIRAIKPFHAHVTIEPLARGFGHTLGNSLRRVMMSSIPGCAATQVKIDGVVHEYESIDGMREDVIWLLLNLKKVVFKIVDDSETATVRVSKQGPCTVTAGDIEVPHNVEVINKDHVLATLTKRGKLQMEITVEKGVGYQPAAVRNEGKGGKTFGMIYLDALFSPVRRAAFQVESTRVANRTDLDRLILDIETDGTLDFEEALQQSAALIMDQLNVFAKVAKYQPGGGLESGGGGAPAETPEDNPFLSEEVTAIGLSVRSQNCLEKESIRYVGELVKRNEKDLMKTPYLGRKSLVEIKLLLEKHDLSLGMELPDWTPPAK